jgi:protein tyrosine/serine phosphatase
MRRINLLLQATLLGGLSVVDSFSSPGRFTKNLQAHSVAMTSTKDDAVDKEFQEEIKALCKERNLPLAKVKNCRDLHSTKNSPVKEGRLFRTGRMGDATDEDQKLLFDELGIKTLVDLRSPTELKDDPALNADLFSDFTDLVWIENGRGRDGCIRKLGADESPIKRKRFRRNKQEDDDEFCDYGCDDPKSLPAGTFLEKKESNGRKERHFVSLMNEFKYVRGTVSKLPKRTVAKSILKSPGAFLSKRIWNSLKKPFISEINDGGLSMLNELLLRFGAPGIKYVLDLCADRTRHPVAFYCTAGKDRTGTIAAIILSLLGVGKEDIVEDYSLSANVYAEMNDHQAMVGALSQRSLDPKTFLGAPPEVMADTLRSIEENYGSVEGYCDWIGFGPEQREKLRKALLED